jgi:hypothetical protein
VRKQPVRPRTSASVDERNPPDTGGPYVDRELAAALADPSASPQRLFCTYRARHDKRKPSSDDVFFSDTDFSSFARNYARHLIDGAHSTDLPELVRLLDHLRIRDAVRCAHIIWDDARPRQLHIWPEGNRWGETPPLRRLRVPVAAHTYTVCGTLVTDKLLYTRAYRGEWASCFRSFQCAHSTEPDGADIGLQYVYGVETRRICPDCAIASGDFPECAESTDRDLPNADMDPPDWWFEPIRVEATAALAAQIDSDKAFTSLARLNLAARKAYRAATGDWLARRMHAEAGATLRRLFGCELHERGRSTPRDVFTEYDQLERDANRTVRRAPHELLTKTEWRKLVKASLPGAPLRRSGSTGRGSLTAADRFRVDVWARLHYLFESAK